jgi:hypothetical protein
MEPGVFRQEFDHFECEAFRLETLDHYVAENEREPLERFRSGLPQDPVWREPWMTKVAQIRGRGAAIGRVHVVSEPLSEYVVFELTCAYPANVAAGEDIRILPRSVATRLCVPNEDFWLFDERRSGLMAYDDVGRWLHVEMTEDVETIRRHARLRDVARAEAVPLLDFLKAAGLEPAIKYPVLSEEGQ